MTLEIGTDEMLTAVDRMCALQLSSISFLRTRLITCHNDWYDCERSLCFALLDPKVHKHDDFSYVQAPHDEGVEQWEQVAATLRPLCDVNDAYEHSSDILSASIMCCELVCRWTPVNIATH